MSFKPTDFLLQYDEDGALCAVCPAEMKFTPIKVDFLQGRLADRVKRHTGWQEPLAKALGLKPEHALTVIDACAGFGRESLLLASLGCTVFMIEQSSIMAALLKDGLQRAQKSSSLAEVAQRMSCIEGAAQSCIPLIIKDHTIDAVYLDPMFPERKKKAAVKKEMQFLHAIVGHQSSEDTDLFLTVLKYDIPRIVIKRPLNAKPLADLRPHHSITAGSMRFDIYLRAFP